MRTLPSGTVTFLFTDVEGWRRLEWARTLVLRSELSREGRGLGDAREVSESAGAVRDLRHVENLLRDLQ